MTIQRDPRLNHLLAALPREDYRRLLPLLVPVELPAGQRLHAAGRPEPDLYFLTAGTVSRACVTQSGASTEFALTGREGVVGVTSFLSGEGMPTEAVVVGAGHAYRMRADALGREFERGGALPDLLLGYTRELVAQAGQAAICNRFHSLEQRLCRWILSSLDRTASSEIMTTHNALADTLGVRREGITDAIAKLRRAGLIHYPRGRIVVLDRAGLEARTCECYAALRRECAAAG